MKKILRKNVVLNRAASRKVIGAVCLTGIMIFTLTGCSRKPDMIQRVDTAMGTMIQETLYVTDRNSTVQDAVLECINSLEAERLSWRLDTSELYRVNQSAFTDNSEMVPISHDLWSNLAACMEIAGASNGAFDVTIGEVTRLWNLDTWSVLEDKSNFELPSSEQLQEMLQNTGYEKIQLEEDKISLRDEVQLDLGAVGKGIALDEIKQLLEQQKEVTGAVVSVGGSILTYGQKPDGSSWKVRIVNPNDTASHLGTLSLNGQWCVSTSGDYERYVEVDGVRYHHIIDPATGYPADSGVRGVTILTKDGLLSDALSTACFVLGIEDGMKLAGQYGAEALFVDKQGEIRMTEGMEQYFHLSNEAK